MTVMWIVMILLQKIAAANISNDLQALLKLIILKMLLWRRKKVKVVLTKTPPVQVGCPNTPLSCINPMMKSLQESHFLFCIMYIVQRTCCKSHHIFSSACSKIR